MRTEKTAVAAYGLLATLAVEAQWQLMVMTAFDILRVWS
jgi:hypothetical protein